MKKSHILILILVASAVRLAPTLWTGMPFSTDAWPLISNAETLVGQTPIALSGDAFGGYNNFWPASQIFGVLLAQVTSLSVMDSMTYGVPLAGSISVIIFYVIAWRIASSEKIAFLSALILTVALPLAHFTAGVTKETFALPLYLLLVLLFLHKGDRWRTVALFSLVSAAVVTAHHFTSLMVIAILSVGAGVLLMRRFWNRLSSPRVPPALVVLLASSFALYYLGFAEGAAFALPPLSEWISAGGYQAIALFTVAYLTLKSSEDQEGSRKIKLIGVGCVVLAFGVLSTQIRLVGGAPTLPLHYLLYGIPFFLAAPLAILGFRKLRGSKNRAFALAWLASVLAVLSYAALSGSGLGWVLGTRTLNFLLPPLAIFLGAGLLWVYRSKVGASRTVAVLLATFIITSSVFTYYAAVVKEEKHMGYQALCTQGEFEAGDWISERFEGSIAGDMKSRYLLGEYYGMDVNVVRGYSYLSGRDDAQPPALYVYRQMYKNGYIIGSYPRSINWEQVGEMHLVYTNGLAKVYGRFEG